LREIIQRKEIFENWVYVNKGISQYESNQEIPGLITAFESVSSKVKKTISLKEIIYNTAYLF